MQIPIEALSLLTLRTGSGIITRPVAPAARDDFLFGKMLEAAQSDSAPARTEAKGPDLTAEGKKPAPFTDKKRSRIEDIIEEYTNNDMSVAAGVMMGNQNKVVFILEGDMESGTDPVIDIAVTTGDAGGDIYAAISAESEDTVFMPDDARDETVAARVEHSIRQAVSEADTSDAADFANAADAAELAYNTAAAEYSSAPVAEGYADGETAVDADKKTVAAETDADAALIDTTGEVTARMPAIRTSEQSETKDGDNDPASFKDGNLSPLENENDKTTVKGRKDKDYAKTEETASENVKSAEAPPGGVTAPIAEDVRPERFRADQAMQKAADSPVRPENLYDEMVSRIETNITESAQTMTIQLKPEFLGKVALEIAMDAAGLHVKISADDQGVRSMVNSQINALIETLTNKGIEVVEVEVAYTGIDNGAFTDPRKQNAQQTDSPKKAHRFSDDAVEEVAFAPSAPLEVLEYYIDEGVSSVEYRA